MMAVLAEREKIEMPSKLSIEDFLDGRGSDALESSSSSRSQGDCGSGMGIERTHSQKVSSQTLQPLSLNISQIDPKQHETTTTTTTNNSTSSSPQSNSEELNNKISKKVVEQSNSSPTSVLRKRLLLSSSDREKDVDLGMPHNSTTSDSIKVVVSSNNTDQTSDGLSTTTRSSIIFVSVDEKEARTRRRPSKRVSFHAATKPANHQAKCSSTSSSNNVDEIDFFAPGTTSHLNSARRRMQQMDRQQQKQQRQQHLLFPIFVLLFVILLEIFIFLSKSPAQHIKHYDGTKKYSQPMSSQRQPPSSSFSNVQI